MARPRLPLTTTLFAALAALAADRGAPSRPPATSRPGARRSKRGDRRYRRSPWWSTALIAVLIAGHRSGRIQWLGRLAAPLRAPTGLPGVGGAAVGTSSAVTLLIAVFGMYWDISLHIDKGRDPGPLANPAHYFILVGLFGVLLAGVLRSPCRAPSAPSRTVVRSRRGWYAPSAALMIAACGAFALIGFPLDDIWHRLFGQDVTLWGPTHLMLIGGAVALGARRLVAPSPRAMAERSAGRRRGPPAWSRSARSCLAGGLPRRALHLPGRVRLRRAAVPPRLAADADHARRRRRPGRRAHLARARRRAAARSPSSSDPRDLIALLVGAALRPDRPALPALHRRGAARGGVAPARIAPRAADRRSARSPGSPSARSASPPSGAGRTSGCRSRGPAALAPGGGDRRPHRRPRRRQRSAASSAGAPVAGVPRARADAGAAPAARWPRWRSSRLGLPMTTGASAPGDRVAHHPAARAPKRDGGSATIRLHPRDAAHDARWLEGDRLAGRRQRGRSAEADRRRGVPDDEADPGLRKLEGDGAAPEGADGGGVPIFLPKNSAIPAAEIPAASTFTRDFRSDREVLQRERKAGVPASLSVSAYVTVLAIALSLFALLGWSLIRLESGDPGRRRRGPRAVTGRATSA